MSDVDIQASLLAVAVKLDFSYMFVENKGFNQFKIKIDYRGEDEDCLINFMKEMEKEGFKVTCVEIVDKTHFHVQIVKP